MIEEEEEEEKTEKGRMMKKKNLLDKNADGERFEKRPCKIKIKRKCTAPNK